MITIDNFESIVPYKILVRGEQYYRWDAVSDLEETSPGEWTATVDGTDRYSVNISMNGAEIDSWDCDCPYDGEICKHVVATLLTIRNPENKVSRRAFSKMKIEVNDVKEEETKLGTTVDYDQVNVDIKQCLSLIDSQELSQFICDYASTNKEFRTALLNRFVTKEISVTSKGKDYKTEIEKIFANSLYNTRTRYYNRYKDSDSDWETVFNQLDVLLEKADFFLKLESIDSTIAIALQTLRSIGENYNDDLLYDDDLSPSIYCEQAGDLILKVIQHPKTTQQQKTEILHELSLIAQIWIYCEYDIYDVDELMMQINLAILPVEKALELIDRLLEERKDAYDLYQLVLRKVDLLLNQKEQEKADETIRQYLYLSEIRKMEVGKLMTQCRYEEAIRLLDEGIELTEKEMHAGSKYEWLKLKLAIYEKTNRTLEIIDTCRLLFISGRDQLDYYHKLKALIPTERWKDFLDSLMKEARLVGGFSYYGGVEAEIYVREKDNDRLFHWLTSEEYKQLDVLMRYSHYLKDTHSEQLIAIYTSLLVDYAERNIGRSHYEHIAQVLLCMQKLNGGNVAVKYLVSEFRTKYNRRRAMMEVMMRF